MCQYLFISTGLSNTQSGDNMLINQFAKRSLLCLSGGVDSMVLFDLMGKELIKSNINELHIIHVNHGSTKDCDKYEDFVRSSVFDFQKKYNVKNVFLTIKRLNLLKNKEALTELHCREKRYNEIFKYCVENNINDIYTAHHKDDFLENNFISVFKNRIYSILMQEKVVKVIEKNSKNKDWGWGNFNKLNVFLHKPFLKKYSKEELLIYSKENNIHFIQDETNYIADNVRNVLRNGLFNHLKDIVGYENYINSMNSFFDFVSTLISYQSKIINKKILPLLKLKEFKKDELTLCEAELELKLIENYLLKDNSIEDRLFLVEIVNLFFFQIKNKYLKGKQKKCLNDFFKKSIDNKKVVLYNTKTEYLSVNLKNSNKLIITLSK